MINNIFKEYVSKNNILINKSNKLCVKVFDNFSGSKNLSVVSRGDVYGYAEIFLKGVHQVVEIKYNGIIVFSESSDGYYRIPLKFLKSAQMYIYGFCDKMILGFYGANINGFLNSHYIPLKNLIVNYSGFGRLCSYQDVSSILNNEFLDCVEIGDGDKFQAYNTPVASFIMKISTLNGAYYSTNINNYTNIECVSQEADDCVFLQNDNISAFVYLKGFQMCYKLFADEELGLENEVFKFTRKPIGLLNGIVNARNNKFFAVEFDGSYCIYILKSNNLIEKVYEIKAENIRLLEDDEFLKIVVVADYNVDVVTFSYDESKAWNNILRVESVVRYNNAIDYIEIGDDKILTSISGIKNIVDYD